MNRTVVRGAWIIGVLAVISVPGIAGSPPWADSSPFISEIDAAMETNLREIAAAGEILGREPGRMGQIGDSITESSAYFRNAVMNGVDSNETEHDYAPVRSWLSYNNAQPADANSFYRFSGKGPDYGCASGWSLNDAVNAGHPSFGVVVGDNGVPGNYSWVLVMFGTNDIDSGSWNATNWKAAYKSFIESFIGLGVVPVLSTIPPEQAHVSDGKVQLANQKIVEIAAELNIPVVDYYALILFHQPTNWNGTLISGDGTHPSAGGGGTLFSEAGLTTADGYAARTKLTFDVAEILRDRIFEGTSAVEGVAWGPLKARYR